MDFPDRVDAFNCNQCFVRIGQRERTSQLPSMLFHAACRFLLVFLIESRLIAPEMAELPLFLDLAMFSYDPRIRHSEN